jgi:hypothetical protein
MHGKRSNLYKIVVGKNEVVRRAVRPKRGWGVIDLLEYILKE